MPSAVRQNGHVAATFAMGVNDPTPAISGNDAAIAPGPTGIVKLVSDPLSVFHWRHDARIKPLQRASLALQRLALSRWLVADLPSLRAGRLLLAWLMTLAYSGNQE